MSNLEDLIKKQKALELEIEEMKNQIEDQKRRDLEEKFTPAQRMADFLHAKLCTLNHTDQCSYYYESWEDPRWERKRELKRAEKLLSVADYATIKKIINLL